MGTDADAQLDVFATAGLLCRAEVLELEGGRLELRVAYRHDGKVHVYRMPVQRRAVEREADHFIDVVVTALGEYLKRDLQPSA